MGRWAKARFNAGCDRVEALEKRLTAQRGVILAMADSDAVRSHRHRLRTARRLAVLRVEVRKLELVDDLIEAGLLAEADCDDDKRVAAATSRALEQWRKRFRHA